MQLRAFLEEKGFHRIPLKKLVTGHYKFEAKINDIKGSFILDTGASTSCVGMDAADYFEMVVQDSDIKAAGAGAINMNTKVTHNNSFQVNDWKTRKMEFVLFDLSHVNHALTEAEETPVNGIIGGDLLKKCRAVIDYGRNCLYLK